MKNFILKNKKIITFIFMFLCIFTIIFIASIKNVKGDFTEIGTYGTWSDKYVKVSVNNVNKVDGSYGPIYCNWEDSEIYVNDATVLNKDLRQLFSDWKDDSLKITYSKALLDELKNGSNANNISLDIYLYNGSNKTKYNGLAGQYLIKNDNGTIKDYLGSTINLTTNEYTQEISLTELLSNVRDGFLGESIKNNDLKIGLELVYIYAEHDDYGTYNKFSNLSFDFKTVKAPYIGITTIPSCHAMDGNKAVIYYGSDEDVKEEETAYLNLKKIGNINNEFNLKFGTNNLSLDSNTFKSVSYLAMPPSSYMDIDAYNLTEAFNKNNYNKPIVLNINLKNYVQNESYTKSINLIDTEMYSILDYSGLPEYGITVAADNNKYFYKKGTFDVPSNQITNLSMTLSNGSLSNYAYYYDLFLDLYMKDSSGNKTKINTYNSENMSNISLDLSNSGIINKDDTYTFSYVVRNTYTKKSREVEFGTYSFKGYNSGSVSGSISGGIDGIYYTKDVKSSNQAALTINIDKGDLKNATYKVYAVNTENNESTLILENSSTKNLSGNINGNYLDGNYKFKYEISYTGGTPITNYINGEYTFVKNEAPKISNDTSFIYSEKDSKGIQNFYYGNNIPENEKAILKIVPTDDGIKESYALVVKANSNNLQTYNGNDVIKENEINLSEKISSTNRYSFKYTLNDGIANEVSGTFTSPKSSYDFRTFNVATLNGTISGGVEGIYYTNYVKAQNHTKIKIDFAKNDNTNATYKVFANGVLISSETESVTKEFDLSEKVGENFLNGSVKLSYIISSENVEHQIGTYNFIENDKPVISDVSVTSAKNGFYFFGDSSVTNSLKTTLSLNIQDSVQLKANKNNLQLKVENSDGTLVFSKTGTDILGNKSFNLSDIIKIAGNYRFKYILDDGIGNSVSYTLPTNPLYNFQKYELPKIGSTNISSGHISGTKYTGYVSDTNKTTFNTSIIQNSGNTVTKYKIFIGKSSLTKQLLKEISVTNSGDLNTSIDLSSFLLDGSYLNGNFSFFYEIVFAENSIPVIGEFTSVSNTPFVKNEKPYINELSLTGDSDGRFYTKDVKESRRTKLSYKVNDNENYSDLTMKVYYDKNSNGVYDNNEEISELSTSKGVLGSKLYDFTNLNLFWNNESNVALRYLLDDSIGNAIDESIGTYSFVSNTKPGIDSVKIDNTFGSDLTVYYAAATGDVALKNQAMLSFNIDKVLKNENVKAKFSLNDKIIPLTSEGTNYKSNLSTLTLNTGVSSIMFSLDDEIADAQYFYLTKDGGVKAIRLENVAGLSESTAFNNAALKGYKFPIKLNKKPVINSNSKITIPSINSGIVYTKDVRDEKRSSLTIKVDDDCFISDNLYDVYIGTYKNPFKETISRDNKLANYDLSSTELNGNLDLYIVLDDGIADIQKVNISGANIDLAGKNSLNMVLNNAPQFIENPNVSNTTNNQIFYGDVNVPEVISELTFKTSEDCEYKINNASYYGNKNYSLALFDEGNKDCIGNTKVSYNVTAHNYDKFSSSPSFSILVSLDDHISNIVTKTTSSYTFVKNKKPEISGSINYGKNTSGGDFKSIFVGLDDSAQIEQTLNLSLLEDSVKVGNYKYSLYQTSSLIDSKESSSSSVPVFNLAEYGKNNVFRKNVTENIVVSFSDGIWDSLIANQNYIIPNVKFSQAGKPSADVDMTGAYNYNNNLYIYDKSMNPTYAGSNCFNKVSFSAKPASANTEISLSSVFLEFTMNDADYESSSGWASVTGDDRKTSLFTIDDFNSNNVVVKDWLNNTGNDSKLVKFRLRIIDELGQESFVPISQNKSIYLAREYAPGYPSKFLMYEGDATNPTSNYTLEVGKTYRFDWTKASDVNLNQGDDIVKYIFTTTTDSGSVDETIDVKEIVNNIAGSKKWLCEKEGSASFSISAIDKFGMKSRIKTIAKDSIKNTNPNDINPSDIKSTFTTTNGLDYLKIYTSDSSATVAETTYTLSWLNAGDDDEGDYVAKWLIEYSTDRNTWHELGYKDNTGNTVKVNEKVSYNYTLRESLEGLKEASEVVFRIRAFDTRNSESEPMEGNSYKFTYDNKKPIWDDLDKGKVSFNSPEGYALTINAEIKDSSKILFVKINDVEIPFEETETGIKFTYTTYKNGTYKFRISDIYNNILAVNQTVTGIDSVPPTVTLSQGESIFTNEAYKLNIACVDSVTGIKKIKISYTDLNGKVNKFESNNEFEIGAEQVDFKYDVYGPGLYEVTVYDRADNETKKSIEIDNINLNKPTSTYSMPEDLQNKSETISLNATVQGTKLTSGLGTWSILQTSTIKNYGTIKVTSVDSTDASIEVFENGTLDMVFTDVFGNVSDTLHINVNNILEGDVNSDIKYLMLESDYKANYKEEAERVVVNGVPYIVWNNKQTTSCQLFAYVKVKADFKGLQYAWLDSERSGKTNSTYSTSYSDDKKPDSVLFKFNSGKKAFYIVDIFGNYTQVVLTINGYVAPPACEIKYTILNKDTTADGVDVYFEITSGKFVDNGFYKETNGGIIKNLYDDFVWGSLIDGKFVADSTYKLKSFKYTFKENGLLKVWGQSNLDDSQYESVLVNITNIDKSVPLVAINDYDKITPKADSLTLTATTNGEFIDLTALKAQIKDLGYGLTDKELNSYKVSDDKKTASITLYHNASGIFFYAKNSAGTLGNCDNISVNNIYESNLAMDIWVYFENGDCISYEEYSKLEDKSSIGTVTVKAISSNTSKDTEGNFVLRKFDEAENPDCIITDSAYSDGGNMVTASYIFIAGGTYTFKLRDSYTGYLEKTVVIGDIKPSEDLPSIEITTENIRGENVPYVVSVKIKAITYDEDVYFLDDDGKLTDKTFVEKIVTENGIYTFKVQDKYGNIVDKDIEITNIFGTSSKPSIEISYEKGFTNKEVVVSAIVSNGKFIDVPKDWVVLSVVNGKPVNIQKIVTENEEISLKANNFYDDASSVITRKVSITNIDKEAPIGPDIDFDIDSDGLLLLTIIDNGDYGSSGTNSFVYEIYSDSSNYKQSGTATKKENQIKINASDRTYKDGEYILKISAIDNAGNTSDAVLKKFNCNNSLVKDFMSTYNTIVSSSNREEMADFYNDLIKEARESLDSYTNDVQKQFVSNKCDLLDEVLTTGDAEQVILVSQIENWLKSLAKNPSDTSFVKDLKNAINSLNNTELQKKYNLQLDSLLNQGDIISLKKNAPSEFNYSSGEYIINPLGGIIYKLNIEGHFTENGDFEKGIDSNNFYYLKDGTKIDIDFTYQTFTDIKGNIMNTKNGLVNGISYYDSEGNLVANQIVGGFYDALGFFHKTYWNGGGTGEETKSYTVTFIDFDGRTISTVSVKSGQAATAPSNPVREGYTFVKWDKNFDKVKSDLVVSAIYEQNGGEIITPSPSPSITPVPDDEKIAVTKISLDKTSVTVKVGDSVFINASILPLNATNTSLKWTSSNSNVAVVEDGTVVPLNAGTTRITATSHNNLSASCLVKVVSSGTSTGGGNVIIPPTVEYPTIGDITTPTPGPITNVGNAPSYYTGYLGSLMVGLTSETNYSAENLRGFYNCGLSTLLYDGSGNIDIANKKNAGVSLGFKGGSYALVMNYIDVNSSYYVGSFGLNASNGTVSLNGETNASYGLGNNSYLVIFSDYSSVLTIAKDGNNIACNYDSNLLGYVVMNPSGGTYTLQPISKGNLAPTDLASRYGFTNDTYSNPVTYKEVVKMAYNALNRDSGEELFSNIDVGSEIYREASILQKYGIIGGIPSNVNSPIGGKDAYDILYLTLSQTNPYDINYNVSEYRYMSSLSLQDLNNMIANIVQYY